MYTPVSGFAGVDDLTYEITDETGQTATATVTITVDPPDAPIAADDAYATPYETSLVVPANGVMGNDAGEAIAVISYSTPLHGTVFVSDTGSFTYVPDDGFTGTDAFDYTIEDAVGQTVPATVTVTVFDWKTNTAPKPKRTTKLSVETGGTVSYNVLPDWIDPEGDDLYLKSVVAAPGDEVEFTTDGQITYKAVASLQGRKNVEIVVADAMGETASGTILLDVKPAGTTNPLTNADHVVTRVGETVSVAPLTNDTSSGQERLRLARVEETEGATIVADYPNDQFTFKAAASGTYYVQYLATAGPKPAKGLVRVDVLDKQESELPPVAVRDVALLPKGSEALIGVLNNDSDPSGGVRTGERRPSNPKPGRTSMSAPLQPPAPGPRRAPAAGTGRCRRPRPARPRPATIPARRRSSPPRTPGTRRLSPPRPPQPGPAWGG